MWFFVQLCNSWQDSNWLKDSRSLCAAAELLVYYVSQTGEQIFHCSADEFSSDANSWGHLWTAARPMQARSWPGGSWGPDPPWGQEGDPCKSCKSKEKILPPSIPTPTTHPHLKQDRDLPWIFSASEWREGDGWMEHFWILRYPIIPISESCYVIGNLRILQSRNPVISDIAGVMM